MQKLLRSAFLVLISRQIFCPEHVVAEATLSLNARKQCPFLANGQAFISSLPLVLNAQINNLESAYTAFPLRVKPTTRRSTIRLLCTASNSGGDENKDQLTGLEGLSAAEIEALPDLGSFMREGVETIEEIMAQDIRFVSLLS